MARNILETIVSFFHNILDGNGLQQWLCPPWLHSTKLHDSFLTKRYNQSDNSWTSRMLVMAYVSMLFSHPPSLHWMYSISQEVPFFSLDSIDLGTRGKRLIVRLFRMAKVDIVWMWLNFIDFNAQHVWGVQSKYDTIMSWRKWWICLADWPPSCCAAGLSSCLPIRQSVPCTG